MGNMCAGQKGMKICACCAPTKHRKNKGKAFEDNNGGMSRRTSTAEGLNRNDSSASKDAGPVPEETEKTY